jgi:signal transduction histidine kinase
MNIRSSVLAALLIMSFCIFLSTTLAINSLVMGNIQKLETENAVTLLNGVNRNLVLKTNSLLNANSDWSFWDNTYRFVNGEYQNYIGRDYSHESLDNLGISIFLILDKNGNMYYSDSNVETDWTQKAVNQIVASGEFRPDDENWNLMGYTTISDSPILLVANPILMSNYTGPIAGTLIWGKIMTDESLVDLSPASESDLMLSLDLNKSEGSSTKPNITTYSDSQLLGIVPLASKLKIFPQMQITALFKRTIYLETRTTTTLFLLILAMVQIVSIGAGIWLLDTKLIQRFKDLNLQIKQLDVNKPLQTIEFNRSNEIAPMVNAINMLLKEIENYKVRLTENERLATMGQTASMVGHDLRNPLQTITLTSYLIRKQLTEESERISETSYLTIKKQLDMLDNQIIYMDKIVGDIQAYSTTLKPKLERTSILKIANDTLATLALPNQVQVYIENNQTLPEVEVDIFMFRRVFGNLLSNAAQAMSNGGLARLYFEEIGGNVVVSVQDTGPGISESSKSMLFKPFYTTKAKGTGLGLVVSKRIIEAHGGKIDFESTVGVGTRFYFTLPLSHANTPSMISGN